MLRFTNPPACRVAEVQKRSAGIEHGWCSSPTPAGISKVSRLCLWTIKVASGWRDFGLKIRGPPARELAAASDEMFARANLRHKPFSRLRKSAWQRTVTFAGGEILLAGPGRNNAIKLALSRDLKRARRVTIICAYFLPPGRILRQMARLARRGIKVQLILPGKSDVFLSPLAAQSFYHRLLRAGVETDRIKARLARWESYYCALRRLPPGGVLQHDWKDANEQ